MPETGFETLHDFQSRTWLKPLVRNVEGRWREDGKHFGGGRAGHNRPSLDFSKAGNSQYLVLGVV